jgi:5-(carboxyamino)imidazole ribonucleotide synthase
MAETFSTDIKLGIIAGGQLGKMLIQEASKWDIATYILDGDDKSPASSICNHHFQGSRLDYLAVYSFGKKVDILTFEIESINIDALLQLKSEGVKIVPDPSILKLFQNKERQKDFYVKNNFPTSAFSSYATTTGIIDDINNGILKYPFVQKLAEGGYDGRGVAVIKSGDDLPDLLTGASIVEEKVDIYKEIAVIVARNAANEVKSYPAVEMVFDKSANLVEKLICPADISDKHQKQAAELAERLITELDMCGLLAIEFFIDASGNLLLNESAPRPHNSGHHTIESVITSQFEQHIRAILNLPLGSTEIKTPSVMLNLLGEPGYHGITQYEGFNDSLSIAGVKIHLYGKKETRPFRKMGHVTIIDKSLKVALEKAEIVKNKLKVKA